MLLHLLRHFAFGQVTADIAGFLDHRARCCWASPSLAGINGFMLPWDQSPHNSWSTTEMLNIFPAIGGTDAQFHCQRSGERPAVFAARVHSHWRFAGDPGVPVGAHAHTGRAHPAATQGHVGHGGSCCWSWTGAALTSDAAADLAHLPAAKRVAGLFIFRCWRWLHEGHIAWMHDRYCGPAPSWRSLPWIGPAALPSRAGSTAIRGRAIIGVRAGENLTDDAGLREGLLMPTNAATVAAAAVDAHSDGRGTHAANRPGHWPEADRAAGKVVAARSPPSDREIEYVPDAHAQRAPTHRYEGIVTALEPLAPGCDAHDAQSLKAVRRRFAGQYINIVLDDRQNEVFPSPPRPRSQWRGRNRTARAAHRRRPVTTQSLHRPQGLGDGG